MSGTQPEQAIEYENAYNQGFNDGMKEANGEAADIRKSYSLETARYAAISKHVCAMINTLRGADEMTPIDLDELQRQHPDLPTAIIENISSSLQQLTWLGRQSELRPFDSIEGVD